MQAIKAINDDEMDEVHKLLKDATGCGIRESEREGVGGFCARYCRLFSRRLWNSEGLEKVQIVSYQHDTC